jgi:hypothetical protein
MTGFRKNNASGIWFIVLLISMSVHFSGCRTSNEIRPALIPMPQEISWTEGVFRLTGNEHKVVKLIVDSIPGVALHTDEAYSLEVTPESVILQATSDKGLFRGEQTLRQLTYVHNGRKVVAGCSITDFPAFQIRGFMQDVGRNYMSLPLLKEQIDVLAAYKYNVFHFHVTDNPGWRLESKLYPELKDPSTMSRWPGKYYTQEEFKELVDYCHERHIMLIPELDIPGHSAAFRKALGLETMSDPRVKDILVALVDELCSLAPPEKMPYIHLGTDEVWHDYERPAPDLLPALAEAVRSNQRELIVWRPGQYIENDSTSIKQLWSSNGHPKPGHRYLDSRLNYLNHLDPFAGIGQLYFERINGAARGDSLRMGGILCCWNDNNVNDERDILLQNPVYPGILTYSETSWRGQPVDFGENYLARMPSPGDPFYDEFAGFEERLVRHRDLYFQGKPFPYVRQSGISWKIIGPFDHQGDPGRVFPVEEGLADRYVVDGKEYSWSGPYYGGTVHIRHFFGYPSWFEERQGTAYAAARIWSPETQTIDFWIGFHDWSRSAGRRGGPFPDQGEWHNTRPVAWVNQSVVEPPVWNNPGVEANSEEFPFTDENYFFREPAKIELRKGWNQVLLKVPALQTSWKWMFTFVPVIMENGNVREVEGLVFEAGFE